MKKHKIHNYTCWLVGCLTYMLPLSSQEYKVESIDLHEPISVGASNLKYTARNQIVLSDGFSASTTTGSFTAQIDETVTCPPSYGTVINDPESQDYPLKRELNTTNDVGSIPGSFDVSATGAATYSIPINIPPGISGVQPQLSVVYNSQGGNGTMGAGWNLSGLSSISRTGRNLYFDDVTSGIRFWDSDDRLSLDGQRLISITSGKNGIDADDFKTETKTFLTIEKEGTYSRPWFRVTTRDGKIMEYGNGDNAKYESDSKIMAWMLNKVVDEYGNYIKYYYNNDAENGQITLQRIEYGGNENIGTNPVNEIVFGYNKRTDEWNGKIRYVDVKQDLLLAQITVKNNDDRIAVYKFNYTIQDGVSCLYEVIQEDGKGNALNSTMCTWSKTDFNGSYSTQLFNVETGDNYLSGDFNGDGFSDVLTLNDFSCYLNKGSNSGINIKGTKLDLKRSNFYDVWEETIYMNCTENLEFVPDNINNFPDVKKTISGDFDGDGEMEILEFVRNYDINASLNNICQYISGLSATNPFDVYFFEDNWLTKDGYKVYLFGFNGTSLVLEKTFTTNFSPATVPVDFNQDGKTDFVSGGVVYSLDLNGAGSIYQVGSTSKEDYFDEAYWGDLNADGRLDFVTRDGSAYGWDSYSNDFNVLTYGDDVTAIGVMDTDGDGWSELLLLGEPYYEEVYETDPETGDLILDENGDPIYIETIFHGRELYTQNYNFDKVKSFGYFKYQYPTHSATLDINGDGRADLAVFKDNKLQKIYYSSGRLDFTEMALDITVGYNICPGDYNGDGIYELGCAGYTNHIFGTGHPGYLVNGIIDGLNRKTKIEYAPLTDNSVYTKTSPGAYPLININAPVYLVDQVTEDDGVGGESITTYNYQDAKVHTQGKGLLGFAKFTTNNTLAGSSTTSYTINTDYYFTQLASTETKAADDTPVSKVTYGYTTTGTPDKCYFNYASSITDENLLTGHKSEKSITYTGNYLTSEIVKINTNESEVHKTYSGHNSEGSPTGISTTYKRDGEDNITRSESYTYLSNGYLETKTIKGLKTKYFYDSFGNVDKVIAGYETSAPRETEFTYTSDGRFVKEEKDPLDRPTTMKYDAWGNVTETEDPNGLKITNVYDTWGRLAQTTTPDSSTVSTSISWAGGADKPSGNLAIYYTQVTDEDGDFNGAEYFDAMGRSLRKIGVPYKGKKVYTDATYNNKGQLTEAKGPYPAGSPDNITAYTYDSKGRLDTETLPTSVVITHGYPGGSTVTTSYSTGESYGKTTDGAGLVTSASDPGGTINYEYFADGQAREIQAPGGTVYMTYHTTSGLQHTLNDPDAGTMTYTYNVFGEQKTQTDPRGKVTTMEYDDLGRVETKSVTGENQIAYIYDENNKPGTLSRITRNCIDEFAYTYDDLMRLLTETRSDGTESFTYEYTYDSDGNVKTLEYPSGMVLTYT